MPFPFTDQIGIKKRPAIVVSSSVYNNARRDLVLIAVTYQIRASLALGDFLIAGWKGASLLKASIVKPILTTIEQKLILRRLGRLNEPDKKSLQQVVKGNSWITARQHVFYVASRASRAAPTALASLPRDAATILVASKQG